MKGRDKYAKQWRAFRAYLEQCDELPTTFEDAYAVVANKVSGLYREEAEALWNVLANEDVFEFVEIGRNLGGTQFLIGCCCQANLLSIESYDIEYFDTTDDYFPEFWDRFGIACACHTGDSTRLTPSDHIRDFVFIDGGHTGEIVKRDIEIWGDKTRFIGFHDYADRKTNKHKRYYPYVVYEISKAAQERGWKQIGKRGKSEVVFRTGAR